MLWFCLGFTTSLIVNLLYISLKATNLYNDVVSNKKDNFLKIDFRNSLFKVSAKINQIRLKKFFSIKKKESSSTFLQVRFIAPVI